METEIINSSTANFFDTVEGYVAQRKYIERIPDIIQQGLQSFMKFPAATSAGLFLLRDNNFEFEYRSCLPNTKKDFYKSAYNVLVESGDVGTALETGQLVIHDNTQNDNITCAVVPLPVSWGIMGLVIIKTEGFCDFDYDFIPKLCSFLAGMFASTLENAMLFKNLGSTKTMLEQKVAARTMDLAQSQRELKALLDAVQTGIFVIENDTNTIVRTNPVAEMMIGLKSEEIIGTPADKYLQPSDDQNMTNGTTTNKNYESVLLKSSGNDIPIIRTTATVSLGLKHYRIESVLDNTQRKKFEDKLKQANELLELKVQERTLDLQVLIRKLKDEIEERSTAQAELKRMLDKEKELNELKTRFVSMVSHEFRTPLTVIRSAAQMMDKFKSKLTVEEQAEYLQRIIKTVDNVADLIENVIFIGKQDVSKSEQAMQSKIHLANFTNTLIDELKLTMLKPRDINFTFIGAPEQAHTNEKLLKLILNNLISNAVKYSHETPVDVSLYCNEDNFTYIIKDYGIGIPDDEQEKIFQLFYRAENVGKVNGTGIGLPVVMNSLQLMRGRINLESKLNHGTTFTVTVPHLKNEEEFGNG